MEPVTASSTSTITTQFVLPNDTNPSGYLFGGKLLAWMDLAAGVSAHRLSHSNVVTASVNNVAFNHSIPRGAIVTIEAKVSRSFNSSMEVFMDVYSEHPKTARKLKCNEAIYTFVALDEEGNPTAIPEVIPETELEIERYKGALRRRQLSLILAGKMKPEDATELKILFLDKK